jgi:hypothetical protein
LTYNQGMTNHPTIPQAVVETAPYLARAAGCMTEAERADALLMIGLDPERGQLVRGGGGIRKIRFATGSGGKSGGVRIIYYYYDRQHPIFLLTAYAKARQENLTDAQTNAFAKVVKELLETY